MMFDNMDLLSHDETKPMKGPIQATTCCCWCTRGLFFFALAIAFVAVALVIAIAKRTDAPIDLFLRKAEAIPTAFHPFSQEDEAVFETAIHVESFDKVWSTIKKSHWEADLGGVDWEAAKKELRPKVENAKSIKEARDAMKQLIKRLGKSHYGIIPAGAYDVVNTKRLGKAGAGITFRLSEEKILVAAVRKGSSAEKLGVQPGWEIVKAGKNESAEFLRKVKAVESIIRVETIVAFRFENLVSGAPGDEVKCVFRKPTPGGNSEELELDIEVALPPGNTIKFGNLPEMTIDMESKVLDSNVGYFRFNGFFDPVRLMPAFRKAVKEFESADGMIIDIRGNGGGMVGMCMGIAGPLAPTKAPLGVMKMRDNELKLAVNKSRKPYSKKVAVLVDEASASASEILAGGFQDLKIARVFGNRTAGLSLPSTIEKLPNGDGFQYAIANYVSAGGKELEGNGVVPDEIVTLTQKNLAAEIDPVLKKALLWIHSADK